MTTSHMKRDREPAPKMLCASNMPQTIGSLSPPLLVTKLDKSITFT